MGSLTKDLPVLGILGDQVKHVLGLHHLRKGEEAWGGRKGGRIKSDVSPLFKKATVVR